MASSSLNKVLLIGHLGNNPEKKTINTGASVTNFSLATSETWNDQSGSKQEKTEWHRIILWNKLADLAEQYLKKGSQVYLEGRLQTREWQDKEGNKRWTTEVTCHTMKFLGSRNSNQQSDQPYSPPQSQPRSTGNDFQQPGGGAPSRPSPAQRPSAVPDEDFIEDDIPF